MSNSLEVTAQSGDTKAIEALMNQAFASKGILVRVTHSGSTLKVLLRNATFHNSRFLMHFRFESALL